MKTLLTIGGVFFLGCIAASAQEPGAGHCSIETLNGTMAWSATQSGATGPVSSSSGQESYDGKGHMKYFEFYSDGVSTTSFSGTGTYTVSENCIATVTYDSETTPWKYFVSADGEHYFWNNNQGTGVITSGRADRVSHALLVN